MNIRLISVIVLAPATFASVLYAESPFAKELSALDAWRNNAIASAIEPIDRRYQNSLEQLMQRATSNKDLDTALKIKEKLTALKVQSSKLVGTWQEVPGPGNVTVLADGTARHTNGAVATWQTKDGKIEFSWSNGAKHIFDLSSIGEAMHGTLVRSPGESEPWTWKRRH